MRGSQADILKYIQNEKDISRYKISFLEKNKAPSPSQKRILGIEQEFVNLPLENIVFEDVADVAAAISIYRTSRIQFYSIYNIPNPDFSGINNLERRTLLFSKINFLRDLATKYQTTKIEELNPIQNSEIYYEFIRIISEKNKTSFDLEKKIFDSKNLGELLKQEPLSLMKKRARSQAAIYSIGKYIESILPPNINHESPEELIFLNNHLDKCIEDLSNNIFPYYNDALSFLPRYLKNTMGKNDYIQKSHALQNVLDFNSIENKDLSFLPISNQSNFIKEVPLVGNLFGAKKIISTTLEKDADRKVQNKVFGILIPIPRESNEKMSLLYKKIFIDDIDATTLFSNELSNVKGFSGDKIIYYKAILMHPFWMLCNIAKENDLYKNIILKLIGFNDYNFKDINFENKDVVEKINNSHSHFINISSKSRVLTTKTRSEDEGIAEIFGIINSKISEIKEEYNLIK